MFLQGIGLRQRRKAGRGRVGGKEGGEESRTWSVQTSQRGPASIPPTKPRPCPNPRPSGFSSVLSPDQSAYTSPQPHSLGPVRPHPRA